MKVFNPDKVPENTVAIMFNFKGHVFAKGYNVNEPDSITNWLKAIEALKATADRTIKHDKGTFDLPLPKITDK